MIRCYSVAISSRRRRSTRLGSICSLVHGGSFLQPFLPGCYQKFLLTQRFCFRRATFYHLPESMQQKIYYFAFCVPSILRPWKAIFIYYRTLLQANFLKWLYSPPPHPTILPWNDTNYFPLLLHANIFQVFPILPPSQVLVIVAIWPILLLKWYCNALTGLVPPSSSPWRHTFWLQFFRFPSLPNKVEHFRLLVLSAQRLKNIFGVHETPSG